MKQSPLGYSGPVLEGALKFETLEGVRVEYCSTGLFVVQGQTKLEALKKLVEQMRDDADYIELIMMRNESTNQG